MRRYRGSNIKIDWQDDELISLAEREVDGVVDKAADLVVDYAKRNLRVNLAVESGDLVNQIDIRKSKYKHGGLVVVAQGPGNYNRYYASFIELGGHYSLWGKYSRKKGNSKEGPHFEGRPYLRPAVKKVRRMFRKMMVEALAGGQSVE